MGYQLKVDLFLSFLAAFIRCTLVLPHFGQAISFGTYGTVTLMNVWPQRKHIKDTDSDIV
jgi:hypothetical protein